MRTFKVITSSVGGLNNKVYQGGDIVQENNFPPGNANELVAQGFLFETTEPEPEKKEETAEEKELRELEELIAKEKSEADAVKTKSANKSKK